MKQTVHITVTNAELSKFKKAIRRAKIWVKYISLAMIRDNVEIEFQHDDVDKLVVKKILQRFSDESSS